MAVVALNGGIMGSRLLLIGSFLLVTSGLSMAWLLKVIPPDHLGLWILPLVLLVLGGWGLRSASRPVPALFTLLLAASTVWVALTWVWPPRADRIDERLSPASVRSPTARLVTTEVEVLPGLRKDVFATPRTLLAPPESRIQVFAAGLGAPRFMVWHPAGSLLVSVPKQGKILALSDHNDDGVADLVVTFADELDRPHGLAVRGDEVLVAENGRLLSLPDEDSDLHADSVTVLSVDLPTGNGHWTRSLVIGHDGSLFVSAGSSCNACVEKDRRRAAVLQFPPGGGQGRVYATGLRNSVGMALHPVSGELWASDNGRDMLGDELPPEEVNLIVKGADYGWPYCYGDRIPDPEMGSELRCRETLPPAVMMQAHSAPLGICFDSRLPFAGEMLLIAFHGSWNRRVPTGYKLVGIPFAEGRPSGPIQDVVSGWLEDGAAWGRPVAPLVGPDGALYLSDDRAGAIYKITWPKQVLTREGDSG